jgi:acyl carrier protein
MMDRSNYSAQQRIELIVRTFVTVSPIDRALAPDENLMELGLTSIDMVNLMLAIEAEFDVMIPGTNLSPAHFRSIASITRLVSELTK